MSRPKKERRSEKVREELGQYVGAIIDSLGVPEEDRPALGGIVRDRVAFFIQCNYGSNFHFIRNYYAPTNNTLECVTKFIDDNVSYNTIRDHYHAFIEQFKNEFTLLNNDHVENRVVILSKSRREFLSISQRSSGNYNIHDFATTVDYFMSDELTVKVVYENFNTGHQTLEDALDDLIPIRVSRPELYEKSKID